VPKTVVVFYKELDGTVPVLDWLLTDVLSKDKKLFAWCFDAVELLSEKGLELRRPTADYLRDDIYELRIKYYRENYRILYFYYKDRIAVLTHGLSKKSDIPDKDIDIAISRKQKFVKEPEVHTYEE